MPVFCYSFVARVGLGNIVALVKLSCARASDSGASDAARHIFKNSSHPVRRYDVRGIPDTLAAPTATTLFVLFDALLVVLEGLAATIPVGHHRRRSLRAQGALTDACIAFHLRPPHPHTT